MSEIQLELFHHGLLRVLFAAGASSQFAFDEYCRVNGFDAGSDCPEVRRARHAICKRWGG